MTARPRHWIGAHRKTAAAAAAAAAAALAIVGLFLASGGGSAPPRPTPSSVPSSTAELRSPFTGEPVSRLRAVLAVKIDNLVDARPQTGLTGADIVYVLPVEGGLSRFMAVFSSRMPAVIVPVRSARLEDLQKRLSDMLGCRVDVIEEPVRKPRLQAEIDRDRALAF